VDVSSDDGTVSSVRVFVAGGSAVLGRRLVPRLVARGRHATATTTGPGRLGSLEHLSADGVVLDGRATAARMLAGDVPVVVMTEGRGFADRRAGRELGWAPHNRSWRQGFEEGQE